MGCIAFVHCIYQFCHLSGLYCFCFCPLSSQWVVLFLSIVISVGRIVFVHCHLSGSYCFCPLSSQWVVLFLSIVISVGRIVFVHCHLSELYCFCPLSSQWRRRRRQQQQQPKNDPGIKLRGPDDRSRG